MEKNCLVTKYKKTVNNNSLKKRGVLTIYVDHLNEIIYEEQVLLRMVSRENCTITVKGNGFISHTTSNQEEIRTQGLKSLDVPAYEDFYVYFYNSPEPYELEISNKYGIVGLYRGATYNQPVIWYVNLEDLRYITEIEYLSLGTTKTFGPYESISNLTKLVYLALDGDESPAYGNISAFSRMTSLTGLFLSPPATGDLRDIGNILSNLRNFSSALSASITGDTSVFRNNTILETCWLAGTGITGNLSDFSNCASTLSEASFNITMSGDISSLGSHTSLREIYLPYTITGSIEDFVSRQISAGRTTVTTSSPIVGDFLRPGTITFGGQTYANTPYFDYLTWDSTNRIIIYAGETRSFFGNYSYVFAKGATSEEINSWRAAGKTVVVI